MTSVESLSAVISCFFLSVTRVDILQTQNAKQIEDLESLNDEKRALQERMEMLAEKYEDTKDRQELILKRFYNFAC